MPAPPPAAEPFFARLGRALARRPGLALGAALLAVAVGAVSGRGFRIDPGNEAFFLADDPALPALREFERAFATDQVMVVGLEGPVLSAGGLERLEALRAALAALGHVRSTLALTNAKNIYLFPGAIEATTWTPYEWVRDGERTAAEFAREMLAEPLFAGNLVSRDGGMAAIICEVEGRDPEGVEAVRAAARRFETAEFAAHIAGGPAERVEFSETIRRDQEVFVPLIVLMLALLTWLLFRQLWGVLLPLAVVGASVAVTVGLAAATGVALNAATSMLTPVVMVVSVAVSINLLTAYAQARAEAPPGGSHADAVALALARVGLPCLFTTSTTVAGFASLAAGDVPAIRDFGLLCATGVAASYVLALLVLPPLLALEAPRGPGSIHLRPGWIEETLARAAPFLERRRRPILGLAAALAVLGAAGAVRIRVETDILGQLPEGGPLRRAAAAIDRSLAGVNAIEVLVAGPEGSLGRIETLRGIAALEVWLERQEGVQKTFSYAGILARLHEVKRKGPRAIPEDQETLDVYMALLGSARPDDGAGASGGSASGERSADPLRPFLTADRGRARLTARLRAMPASRNSAIIHGLAAEAARVLPEGVRAQPTGDFVLLHDMTEELPFAMLRGLAVATAAIVGMIGLLFRSARLAALAAIPASLPVLAVYGLMGWSGIWLSVPTSMISSVVLGLAVDSTILFLSRYRRERAAGLERGAAVAAMLLSAGQSVTYSNLTLAGGFAVGALSRFPPVRDFGFLASLTIAASYLGALVLLPALMFSAPRGALTESARGDRSEA